MTSAPSHSSALTAMLRKTESQPNLAMGSQPARPANLQTRSLLRRAVQAVGQDAKARRAEGSVRELGRKAGKLPMVNTKGQYFVNGVWMKKEEKKKRQSSPNLFYWDVARRVPSQPGEVAPNQSQAYSSLTGRQKQDLMTKERAMTIMGLFSDYSQEDVVTAFKRDSDEIGERKTCVCKSQNKGICVKDVWRI